MIPEDDRRLEAVLERLDTLSREVAGIARRMDRLETLDRIAAELQDLNRSLEALAYAALGRRPPDVRRKS